MTKEEPLTKIGPVWEPIDGLAGISQLLFRNISQEKHSVNR